MTLHRAAPRGPSGIDAGETLVELLVSIAIIGIAVTAILGGIMMGTKTSSLHRDEAQVQAWLRNWAEKVQRAPYTECATSAGINPDAGSSDDVPNSFVSTSSVAQWAGIDFSGASGGGCNDRGLQLITLRLSGTLSSPVTGTLNVVKRKPCESGC